MVDPRLIEILACPACEERPPVRLIEEGLLCDRCGRVYPIKDDIPEMLVESATFLESAGQSANAEPETAKQP